MKTLLPALVLVLLVGGTAFAQGVTKQEAVKTTKIAQQKAKKRQKEANRSGNQSAKQDADKTLDAAKRAEKQAKKNPQ